ncbi:MAG: TonB-dependent receptor [Chitinophagaceae bacterium]
MRLTALIILLLFSLQIHAAPALRSSLSGSVTDTAGVPLPGAVIELPELHTGTVADVDGKYSIPNLPSGDFLISVKLLSFETQTRNIKLNGTTTADFKLSTAVLEQHEIVVTGTSAATEQRRSPTPIQSISAAALHENVSSNVIDAITRMPGVQQLSTGPAISKPIIRGLGYNRIITLNDGIRQEGQQWGDEHGIEIDDYNVSRVEVLKGPASLTYGSDAIAGVINILSEEPAPIGKIQGLLATGYQTNNGQASLHARLAGNENGFYWSGYYTGKAAHDYKDPYDGYVFDTRFQNNDYGATIGINKHWGSSKLAFTSFNQKLGIAEGVRDSATGNFLKPVAINGVAEEVAVDDADGKSYSQALPRQQINHQKLTLINNFYLPNNARIGLSLGLQQNNRQEFGDVLQPTVPGLNLRLRTFNYSGFYRFADMNGWQITAGANGMVQQNTNQGIEFLVPDYNLFDIGGYVTAKKEIGKWSLAGGVRADYRKLNVGSLFVDSLGARIGNPEAGSFTRFKDFSRSFSSPSGSVGLSYALSKKTTFKANFSAGYRAPNIAELAANGVHEGTIRYEYGNVDLKAENSYQGDLGAEYTSEHLAINAAIFYNHISHFVYTQKLAGISGLDSIPKGNNAEGYPAYQYNQTDANLFGGELYVDLHPHPLDWLHFENTISYVQGRNGNATDSAKYLPNIPATRWLIGLRAQGKKQGKYIGSAYAKIELDNYFAQNEVYSAYGTETASPGYSLLNASIGFDILNKKKSIMSITLAGENLANIGYQNHLSRLRYADVNELTGRTGIFGVGRNISLSLRVPLDLK